LIRYRVTLAARPVVIDLDVDNVTATAPLVVDADPATRTELLSRLLTAAGLSICAADSLDAHRLAAALASPALAELSPVLLDGGDILRHGGTYARQDCAAAALFLGERLAMLAKMPPRPIDPTSLAWTQYLETAVVSSIMELAAWRAHCADQMLALSRVISRELLSGAEPSRLTAETVLACFSAAAAVHPGDPAAVLTAFWRGLASVPPV
jgi:hypothetical protein